MNTDYEKYTFIDNSSVQKYPCNNAALQKDSLWNQSHCLQ